MSTVRIDATTAALLAELRDGLAVHHGYGPTDEQLVANAVQRVHRGFCGVVGDSDVAGTGFVKWTTDRPAEVLLRQIDATQFCLAQPFRYVRAGEVYEVPEDDVTDLASVPRFLTWFVPRYGRHTLAALLHDRLQDGSVTSERADELFRDAMGDLGVPLLRRWLMWAAVGARTQWKAGRVRAGAVALWAGAFGAVGLGGLPLAVVAGPGTAGLVTAGAAAVALLVLLLGRTTLVGRLAGLSGIALLLLATPATICAVALGCYLVLEWCVEHALPEPRQNPILVPAPEA